MREKYQGKGKYFFMVIKNRISIFNNIIKFGFLILLLVGLPMSYFARKNQEKRYELYGDTTICKIVKNAGSDIIYDYNIDGVTYQSRHRNQTQSFREGELYKLVYNSKKPNEGKILLVYPLISDKLSTIKGKVIRQKENIDKMLMIEFQYNIGHKSYNRWQYWKKRNNEDICYSCDYVVKYDKKNPKIAYIFLDSLVIK